ncbi:MAG TPA: DUF3500 domain-containing protein [Pirellulales bacterium]|nr:DUF3500 domain-containing protein [Pirellulales bacterium]
MSPHHSNCPDCDRLDASTSRREFLKSAGTLAAVAAAGAPLWAGAAETTTTTSGSAPETIVKTLFYSLSDTQKNVVCFAWDHMDKNRGLLRTRVANNWHVTQPQINSDFFTKDQKAMIRGIFEGIIQPEWHARIDQQLKDDAGGFGEDQNIAIFGTPGEKFELVMTGRHMTLRCDGNSTEHVAFGGPIFYGHAASGFNEKQNHPGNVFWPQALAANKVYEMLDGNQRKASLVDRLPNEQDVAFRGRGSKLPGLALAEMTADQRALVQEVLQKLIEPYRQSDRDRAVACLKAQGGLDGCSLAFYREGDLGADQVWDCWRLEGPAFVWYFRGNPHVHVWVNVADDPSVPTNA